ncbi:MAG: hypothetical protein P8103_14620 [Candidatus Thiodiazotropha sp.]
MRRFSDHAIEKMIDLYRSHSHEVGSELLKTDPDKYKSLSATDCITYALNVIAYAFEKVGSDKAAKEVWELGGKGTELASYLVGQHHWKGVYLNPDVNHPLDADSEHSYSYHLALKTCTYYRIPLDYQVVNYSITPSHHAAFRKLNTRVGVTALNRIDIASLNLVGFAFGISRGGRHSWLFSKGVVYEVHWNGIGDTLYERSSLKSYPWLSGALVVPTDQVHLLSVNAQLKCGGG